MLAEEKRVRRIILFHILVVTVETAFFLVQIMGDTKNVIHTRRLGESNMMKKMGSMELEITRGYNMKQESTYYQGKSSPPPKSPVKKK